MGRTNILFRIYSCLLGQGGGGGGSSGGGGKLAGGEAANGRIANSCFFADKSKTHINVTDVRFGFGQIHFFADKSTTHIDVTGVRFGFGQISKLLNQTNSCFFADKKKRT